MEAAAPAAATAATAKAKHVEEEAPRTGKFWFSEAAEKGTIICPGRAVKSLLPMTDCIEEMRTGFLALEQGHAGFPLRLGYVLPQEQISVLASMPAFMTIASATANNNNNTNNDATNIEAVDKQAKDALVSKGEGGGLAADLGGTGGAGAETRIPFCASKTITVFPQNSRLNKHSHHGTISLFEGIYGGLLALIDAGEVTGLRTAAASAVATDLLARSDSETLAVFGCGVQAESHIEAMLIVRPSLTNVRVWSRTLEKTSAFVDKQARLYPAVSFVACPSAASAAETADVICTLTPAQSPLLDLGDVRPGCHINAVGACTPNNRELCPALVAKAAVYTDRLESCLKEPGEILDCLQSGLITPEHIRGELGQLLASKVPGRTTVDQITIFESLGVAVQDLVSALRIYRNCLGRETLPEGCIYMRF